MEKLTRKYGLITAICLVVGTVIGSGVFFKAQNVLNATDGNMPLGIAAWAIAGLIMVICSAQFAVILS
jgi:APA family basic amino acid/polyamine antiporter